MPDFIHDMGDLGERLEEAAAMGKEQAAKELARMLEESSAAVLQVVVKKIEGFQSVGVLRRTKLVQRFVAMGELRRARQEMKNRFAARGGFYYGLGGGALSKLLEKAIGALDVMKLERIQLGERAQDCVDGCTSRVVRLGCDDVWACPECGRLHEAKPARVLEAGRG